MLVDGSPPPCDSRDGMNSYSQRDGDTDSKLLSRNTHLPRMDSRPMLAPSKPEPRHYKAIMPIRLLAKPICLHTDFGARA